MSPAAWSQMILYSQTCYDAQEHEYVTATSNN